MTSTTEVEAARLEFLATGRCTASDMVVRREVRASWERSLGHGVDPHQLNVRFVGHHSAAPLVDARAEEAFDEFLGAETGAGCSVVLVDPSGVIRVRRDADPALGTLLDALRMVPGYAYGEHEIGTTAASIALHEQADTTLHGGEHFHAELAGLAAAAALVVDRKDGEVAGVVVVLSAAAGRGPLQKVLARAIADRLTKKLASQHHRRARIVLERFREEDQHGEWVLATDGEFVLTNPAARKLDAGDLQVLTDLVLGAMVLHDFTERHLDLPDGGCAQVSVQPINRSGEIVGAMLTGGPATEAAPVVVTEAVRRQGAHIAPLVHRDYAAEFHRAADPDGRHAEARVRANRDLLTPILRAQEDVAASIRQGRNHLLIGEPGVGKRSLLVNAFRQAYPNGRLITIDCGKFNKHPVAALADLSAESIGRFGDRPHLLLLHGLNLLGPVAARRLDEQLRPVMALPAPPLLMGSVDTPAVDATRPYGLLLRQYHQITRVPALRYRIDEIAHIALSILRRLSARRSLRLSLQVIRVFEGYSWPGNISELEDVLKYVVARKPLGEVQPPDLPTLCFQGRAHKMSMLEAAQCDAIIQALYECGGNRYKAAAMLVIARSSLYRKIDAFDISYVA